MVAAVDGHEVRWFFLPYCIEDLGGGWFIFLNRAYKPLGQLSSEFVDYKNHPSKVKLLRFTARRAQSIGLTGGQTTYYFYDDSTVPTRSAANWKRYSELLAKVARVTTEYQR